MVLTDQVNGYLCDFLADLLFFQHIRKCWQTCHYDGAFRVQTLHGSHPYSSLTREWIVMLIPRIHWHDQMIRL